MAIHVYKCTVCDEVEERLVKDAEKDEQYCGTVYWSADVGEFICETRLEREEISPIAAMSAQWAQWRTG